MCPRSSLFFSDAVCRNRRSGPLKPVRNQPEQLRHVRAAHCGRKLIIRAADLCAEQLH